MTTSLQKPDSLESRLRSFGLKVTPARLAVLHALSKSKKPVTVEEIVRLTPRVLLNQATAYRMMHTFHTKGLIRLVDFQHGHSHYELIGAQEHHHVVCIDCGRVEDVTICNEQQIYSDALEQLPMFESIKEHTLELFGICRACTKTKSRTAL